MNNYIAHISKDENDNKNLSNIHSLKEHIEGVLEFINSFFENNELLPYGRLSAILHDLGKFTDDFQKYIRDDKGIRGTVKHAKYGAMIAVKIFRELSFVIDAHHGSIKNYTDWADKYKNIKQDDLEIVQEVYSRLEKEMPDLKNYIQDVTNLENTTPLKSKYSNDELDIITRLIFSSLVDADWLDTGRFMNLEQYQARNPKKFDVDYLSAKLKKKLSTFNTEGEVNKLRNETRLSIVAKACQNVGFFSLALPTGLGKTLASVSWAIEHARHNNLKRIVIVLPYTSIIDQNAEVLREIFGDEYVLECHSNVQGDKNFDDENKYDRQKLNSENFDSPIVITTTVQFFETLFSNNNRKCRKLHNIMNSVVIFDEVQTLGNTYINENSKEPISIIKPTLQMLKNMSRIFNTSFLFCTATMPAFQKRDKFDGIENIVSLIDEPDKIFEAMKRVEYYLYNDLENVSFENITESISSENSSTLVIVNTKKKALEFYNLLSSIKNFDKVYHLSTNMYPKHRKRIISKIVKLNKNTDKKILLISTQLVEAGVDLDFSTVYREIAPMSSIVQASGRCNREGKMKDNGNVYIFKLEDDTSPLGMYKTETEETALILQTQGVNILHKHDSFATYYQKICNLYQNEKDIITEDRKAFDFDTVAKTYKIIDSNTQAVFIPLGLNKEDCAEIKKLKYKIDKNIPLCRDDYKQISQYSVNMYENAIKKYYSEGLISEHNDVLVWNSGYDKKYGIKLNSSDLDFII